MIIIKQCRPEFGVGALVGEILIGRRRRRRCDGGDAGRLQLTASLLLVTGHPLQPLLIVSCIDVVAAVVVVVVVVAAAADVADVVVHLAAVGRLGRGGGDGGGSANGGRC